MNNKWCYCVIVLLFCIKVCLPQRRIVKGTRTHAHKRYMVYLIQARQFTVPDDSWLCGGALVSPSQILTSAACIVEMEDVYAIAGYLTYVNGMDIDKDNCTKITKRKVIKIRIPRDYLQDFTNSTQWMSIDIGVATVETPYDFEDISFRIYCSYIPAAIQINYNAILEKPETNVVAMGWGRDRGIRPYDVTDRNAKSLQEASLKIKSKQHCKNNFVGPNLAELIDKYMICVHGKGVLDAEGLVLEENLRHANKCAEFEDLFDNKTNYFKRGGIECSEDDLGPSFRRKLVNQTSDIQTVNVSLSQLNQSDITSKQNYSQGTTKYDTTGQMKRNARRQGICQNDHGGPLITWIGTTEILIGVALNSLYDSNYECVGPYLFTSTAAVGPIIKCLLMSKDFTRRQCTSAAELMGYTIVERTVFWNRARPTDDEFSVEPPKIKPNVFRSGDHTSSIRIETAKAINRNTYRVRIPITSAPEYTNYAPRATESDISDNMDVVSI